jgi:XTP/dITP diphosphohydrolase
MLTKICMATTNDKKVEGVKNILGIEVEKISLDLPEIQSVNVEDVVTFSAKDAYAKAGKPVLVNDTGFFIDAWKGLPGALITWFTKYTVGIKGLLKMLETEDNRKATAKTTYAFFDGKEVHIFTGEISGTLTREERGTNGFEWDSIFIPDGYDKTFGEMLPSEKDAVPYYKSALLKLKESIEANLQQVYF